MLEKKKMFSSKKENGVVNIIWSEMDSSSIEYIHYHNDGVRSVLGVTFKSGQSYIYDRVRMTDVINMLKSESVGSFFSKNIRMNYSYKNIGDANGYSPLKKIGVEI